MMDATWSQPPLRDLKPAPFAKQDVRDWNTYIIKRDFTVSVRRVVIPKHSQHSLDFHARSVHRHQNHRLLPMRWRRRIRLAHEDSDLAARVACPRRPPLPAVNNVVISAASNSRLYVCRVG